MELQIKQAIVEFKPIADVFWRMACMAFCIGLAVSVGVAGMVLLIVRFGPP